MKVRLLNKTMKHWFVKNLSLLVTSCALDEILVWNPKQKKVQKFRNFGGTRSRRRVGKLFLLLLLLLLLFSWEGGREGRFDQKREGLFIAARGNLIYISHISSKWLEGFWLSYGQLIKSSEKHFYTPIFKNWNICACVAGDYSLIHAI